MITTNPEPITTDVNQKMPGWRLTSILAIGLSLSIGWGIRGDFGHEYGAAFAGCLAALTGCLLSGRADWRGRVLYFGFFGAIGWGFGGSISYMQVISFTESGHLPSQWYGYTCLFVIGFLWAGLGGAGTAMAAVFERKRLVSLFTPILFVFAAWFVQDLIEDPIANALQAGVTFDHTWSRHKSPLYWFDADYLAALFALLGVCLYDLVERKERNGWLLPVFALLGAIGGWLMQQGLRVANLDQSLAAALTYSLGDASYLDPSTGAPTFTADNFLNNWPQWFGDYPQQIGWVIGLLAGVVAYFSKFGRFRNGASLIVYMASGWLLCFLAFPVFGSLLFTHIGGLRMTPPRSDDWAGILGVFIGLLIWMRRNRYLPVVLAGVVSGTIGGLGFSGIQWVKQLMMAPGNPRILMAKGMLPGSQSYEQAVSLWANWQSQNWHSFLEQSYGFINGLAIAVVLGLLASRIPMNLDVSGNSSERARGRWTLAFSAFFILLAITYVNLVKNVSEWSDQLNPEVWKRTISTANGATETVPALWDVPYLGRLPGVTALHMTPDWWFKLTWILLVGVFVLVIRRHFREPLALVPTTWLGKGQLVFLLLLWIMIIGDFERSLVGWHPSRLLTEWVMLVNALIVTVLLLTFSREKEPEISISTNTSFSSLYKRMWLVAIGTVIISAAFFLITNRLVYQYPDYEQLDKKSYHTRFGPEASWRAKPNLKNALHK